MVYSIEFLIDKLFNSLYFEFIELNKQYNCHVNVSDFFTYQFSELKLFNLLIQQSNPEHLYNEINNSADETGLTDYILYNDNHTLLFECKDIKINGALIETHDYSVIIDYSHKPDALEKVLKILRPITRGRLICLFGCGGDRDRLKRPIMGKIAEENSDICIVTSDNPRTEEPLAIIDEILAGMSNRASNKKVIPDRVEAIQWAVDKAMPGDVILLAGKGHEDYQIVGHEKRHMDEREIVAEHLAKRKK
jgi:folylpolyglutamate synthase/dihydropteroate synthase